MVKGEANSPLLVLASFINVMQNNNAIPINVMLKNL